MKTKLEMAHEWAVELLRSGYHSDDIISCAWQYADAMQAEADKRENKETCDKSLNIDSKELNVEEWQPDWSQAPEWANWWAMDKNGKGFWHSLTPSRDQSMADWVVDFSSGIDFSYKVSPDFNYTGDWRNSLRKRPK